MPNPFINVYLKGLDQFRMEKTTGNIFITVFCRIFKWFIAVISIALFLSGVRFFYLKINKFPEEIAKRIENAKTNDEDKDDKTT